MCDDYSFTFVPIWKAVDESLTNYDLVINIQQ
ncbi:hypothetical protein VHP8226_01534 [Vibrio hippocampi]|uniref:Uncharacterized protein n=1 Tax=Vibrio hippocampi TaxID=654686 RepID=A0ABN8DFJ9_9VIBR|nr:hypothetical protein VHP8226_01534 [Vibrio hippocampi]